MMGELKSIYALSMESLKVPRVAQDYYHLER